MNLNQDFQEGVTTLLKSVSPFAANTVFYVQGEESTQYPYVVFDMTKTNDRSFQTDYDDTTLVLNIYSNHSNTNQINDITESVLTVFDRKKVTLSSHWMSPMIRTVSTITKNGLGNWQSIITYETTIN